LLLACLALAGCSRGPAAVKAEDMAHLGRIQQAYDEATDKLGRPPANAEELKPFLRPRGDPEALLRSPRDGQPYVIQWGVNYRRLRTTAMPPPILVHEQTGVDGKRHVLTTLGVRPMTDEEFARATFVK
jgi:hypothetical protein